jgi:hypothetical protein
MGGIAFCSLHVALLLATVPGRRTAAVIVQARANVDTRSHVVSGCRVYAPLNTPWKTPLEVWHQTSCVERAADVVGVRIRPSDNLRSNNHTAGVGWIELQSSSMGWSVSQLVSRYGALRAGLTGYLVGAGSAFSQHPWCTWL